MVPQVRFLMVPKGLVPNSSKGSVPNSSKGSVSDGLKSSNYSVSSFSSNGSSACNNDKLLILRLLISFIAG
jgi:hypothetical protein